MHLIRSRLCPRRAFWLLGLALVALPLVAACDDDGNTGSRSGGTLTIGGIPDQDVTHLEQQFGLLAEYLADETGLDVEYVPSNDYAGVVSAFQRGDVQLAWFGGLTGVQARSTVAGAEAVAQRARDAEFHSVFIVGEGVDAESLEDLAGLTFTFGSESSTSGHLMPRFFLREAGIDADADLDGPPGFSGSHDRTYELVEAGAFDAGALSEAVWDAAVEEGTVDTSKVRVLLRTPPYFDYNFTLRPDVDEDLGDGTRDRIVRALLDLSAEDGERAAEVLDLFQAARFIETANAHYAAIEEVARDLEIIR